MFTCVKNTQRFGKFWGYEFLLRIVYLADSNNSLVNKINGLMSLIGREHNFTALLLNFRKISTKYISQHMAVPRE